MKKLYILLLSVSLGMSSCSDWLDVMPQTSIPQEELFKNEYGFKDVLTGAYLMMGETALYGKEMTYNYMDMLAGCYEYIPGVYDQETLYSYDSGEYLTKKNAFFEKSYTIIANLNNLLHYIDEKRDVFKTPHLYETIKGEALGLRAYLHFDMLRLFGPVYSQNPEGKAVPYRTELNNLATPVLPASEVIEHCLADLHQADSLLSEHDSNIFTNDSKADAFTVMRQFRMNTWAVKATMARIYLYKGDEESKKLAYDYANEVVLSGNFALQDNNNNPILFDEHVFALYIYEFDKIVNDIFVNANASTVMSIGKNRFNTWFEADGAGVTDFRAGVNAFSTMKFENVEKQVMLKYVQSKYSDDYHGRGAVPLIRLSEMYYIMAECEPEALLAAEYINTVRFSRGIPISEAIDGDDRFDQLDTRPGYDREHTMRINELMKEYRKDFYGEGQLFYFYKRHNYASILGGPANLDIRTKYQMPLPDNEIIFGK